MQIRALELHDKSKEHQRALQLDSSTSEHSPPAEHFLRLLKHMQKSPIGADGLSEVGGQKKCRKMAWALAEALRQKKRAVWTATKGLDGKPPVISSTIYQDARKGRLSVRYTVATSGGERQSGHLGTVDLGESADSISLMKSTDAILKMFATPYFAPPHVEKPMAQPTLDPHLHSRLVNSIEAFISDSASDELRAGFMLAGQSTTSVYSPKLPELKMVFRDRPHATRRNLSRNWKADAFISEVADMFLFNADSPIKMIQNSSIFQNWFASNIQRLDSACDKVKAHKHVRNLHFAAHRFESIAAPLSRLVLFFPAVIQTVAQIARERKSGDEGKAAVKFLRWVNFERCMQVAMMTDAVTENLQLTRLVDFEGMPVDSFPGQILAFRDSIRTLFLGQNPGCLHAGFTSHMIAVLKRPFTITLGDNGAADMIRVGGSTSDVAMQNCLQRMGAWVKLTEQTLETEFPAFEVSQCFSIFAVKGANAPSENGVHLARSSQLSRLLKAFKLPDTPECGRQMQKLWHVARRIANEEGLESVEAWLHAAKHVQRTWSKMDISSILPLLTRFWAAGGSTSGVEQAFSRAKSLTDSLLILTHVNDVMEA